MKTLTAKNDFGCVKQTVALADIMVDAEKSVVDVASSWAIFPRQYMMALDIHRNGLSNPIIVRQDGDKLSFAASGCRIQYAILNGYTHIDAVVLSDDSEILVLMQQQRANDDQILNNLQGA